MSNKRHLGQSRTRWEDMVIKGLKFSNEDKLIEEAYNRDWWNDIVEAAIGLHGPLNCWRKKLKLY